LWQQGTSFTCLPKTLEARIQSTKLAEITEAVMAAMDARDITKNAKNAKQAKGLGKAEGDFQASQ